MLLRGTAIEWMMLRTYRWGAHARLRSPRPTGRRSTMASPSSPRISQISRVQKLNPLPVAHQETIPSPPVPGAVAPKRTEIPSRLARLEPSQPLHLIDNDPVFEVMYAARLLGISQDLLEKWRQRGQGPDYIQYGPGGPVLYALSALEAYKAYTFRPVGRP